jgi:phage baseplate assembly protein gpV
MDRRERINDLNEALLEAMSSAASELWVALPGIVETYDATKMTCTVKPSIQILRRKIDGTEAWVSIPLLLDVPVMFPGGGGFTMTFPVTQGDECLVVFADRCIDSWWDLGGVQVQAEVRMHDLSDGFAFIGVRSRPRALASVSTTNVQLRSDDGAAHIEITPSHDVKVLTSGSAYVEAGPKIQLKATLIEIQGNVTVTGTIVAQGDVTGQTKSLHNHIHSGVVVGGGNTGAPV